MKFLITGANGFVGTNLQKFLKAKGHEIVTLDVANADYSWDELDKLPSVDAVVHLAGKAHDLKKVSSPESYFEINVGLTKKIFEAMEGKCDKFIYFSSIKALDGDTPYAQSKRAAEEYLAGRAIVLEPAMIHGPGNKGNLNLLWGIAKRGIPWPLAAFENRRSFTSIGNICAVVEALALQQPRMMNDKRLMINEGEDSLSEEVENSATYHLSLNTYHCFPIADDTPISTNRLIELIAETCGKKAKLWRVPKGVMRFAAKLGDALHLPLNSERLGKLTEDSIVDNSVVKAALGWDKMPVSAEEGMRETLQSFKNR